MNDNTVINDNSNPCTDPGPKKNDGYSKQVATEKIVNEQDQTKVSNAQGIPETNEPTDEVNKQENSENIISGDISEKATGESEHVTQETLEEDRKHQSGINT